ncbi:hypothetical protein ACGF7U_07980 [Micromonospora sp. NPDC047670]|uniref:hypothetical protein n=1 Tax=Micromonospora sp. NPDC047670 TaxID=3364252 RepID=UPI0037112B9C
MKAHRMDQETVERLLGGPVVDPQDAPRPLASLLTAVRAAPRAGELAGEDAAVRAYRLARSGTPAAAPERGRVPVLARLGVRAALAGVALAVTGGVAFAATGGALPNPLDGPAPATTPAPVPPVPAPVISPTAAPGQPSASATTVDGRPEPSASVAVLCRAFRAGGEDPGRVLDKPVFGDLVRAAGGRGKVAGYCDRLLRDDPGRSDAPGATPTDRPEANPTVRPSGRLTASPSAPAGRPSAPGAVQVTPGTVQVSPGSVQVSPEPGRPTASSGDGR